MIFRCEYEAAAQPEACASGEVGAPSKSIGWGDSSSLTFCDALRGVDLGSSTCTFDTGVTGTDDIVIVLSH